MDKARANRISNELLHKNVGGWTLDQCTGSGKSALVFRAIRDNEVGALKIFDPELVERFGEDAQRQRIERELSLRGKYHPNLVEILGGGFCAEFGFWFVVMRFVDAPNLATVLQDVPRDRIWPIIWQVAQAARFLEDLKLAHRDIKPDNIAIESDFGKAVLLDLGVVRPFGIDSLTDAEQPLFVGTLQYGPVVLPAKTGHLI